MAIHLYLGCVYAREPKKERRVATALLMYTAWNIWKERNCRIFEGASQPAAGVVALIKEEIGLRQSATGVPSVP
ncbi:hypothetical protein PVAP13_1KG071077 [Panicum virgatum]|uniref:Uncharacterized protein n=1 Tax=Panicum virgatum TaxID=38727 RepID=A0A8T0X839_PANVG|nr:hypothetical protein PVAP13_1KG071077 [Panicum virgatum]